MFRLTQHKTLIIPHFIAAVSGLALMLSVLLESPLDPDQLTAGSDQIHQGDPCKEPIISSKADITDAAVTRSWSLLHLF